MSKKSKLWLMLSGASLAAMSAVSPAMAQDDEVVSDEIVVTATGRAAAIQDVPLAVTAIGGEQLQNTGVDDLRDVTQVAPSLVISTGQSNSSGTLAQIRGIGTGSDNPGFEGAVGIFIDGVYRARAGAALTDLPELVRVEILRGPQGTLFGRNTSAGAISVVTAGPDFEPGMWMEGTYGADDLEEFGGRVGANIPLSDTFALRIDGSVRARDGYITDVTSGNDINTTDRWSARGQAQWDISDDASLRVIVDAAETDEVCCGVTPLAYGDRQAILDGLAFVAGLGSATPPGRVGDLNSRLDDRQMTVTPGRDYAEQTEDFGTSAELNWDINGMNFTSITAYRDWNANRNQDIDFSAADLAYRDGLEVGIETLTQEFRLQGEAGPVNWLVGMFYGDETIDTTDRIRLGAQFAAYAQALTGAATGRQLYNGGGNSILGLADAAFNGSYLAPPANGEGQVADNWVTDTTSLSLFTHNEISLSENLVLTVGVRYNQDEKDLSANLNGTNSTCDSIRTSVAPGPTPYAPIIEGIIAGDPTGNAAQLFALACNPALNTVANGAWSGNRDEEAWSGTVSLAYHMSDDVMLYGGYSRGYKSGGYNLDRSGFQVFPFTTSAASLNTDQLAFEPEFTDAYELGVKSTIFGNTTANIALFLQQVSDYQLNSFNGFNFTTRNIPDTISQGVELEFATRPMEGLTLTGGVVYTDAYYDSEVRFSPFTACQLAGTAVACTVPGSTANPNDPNAVYRDQPLSGVSELTVTGSVTYEMPLSAGFGATFYLDGRWNDGYRVQTLSRNPLSDNEGFAIFNGRVSFGPESRRWSVDVWGQNLTDEFYNVGAFQPPFINTTVVYPSQPQTYGVTLRARY
jgi:iron complex outermembrane recepter protein